MCVPQNHLLKIGFLSHLVGPETESSSADIVDHVWVHAGQDSGLEALRWVEGSEDDVIAVAAGQAGAKEEKMCHQTCQEDSSRKLDTAGSR